MFTDTDQDFIKFIASFHKIEIREITTAYDLSKHYVVAGIHQFSDIEYITSLREFDILENAQDYLYHINVIFNVNKFTITVTANEEIKD